MKLHDLLFMITLIPIAFMLGIYLGAGLEKHFCMAIQRKAVALGHAEFVADKEGNVEFKWKEIK